MSTPIYETGPLAERYDAGTHNLAPSKADAKKAKRDEEAAKRAEYAPQKTREAKAELAEAIKEWEESQAGYAEYQRLKARVLWLRRDMAAKIKQGTYA